MRHTKIILGQEYVTASGRHVRVDSFFARIPGKTTEYLCSVCDHSYIHVHVHHGQILLRASDICYTKEQWERKQKHLKHQRDAQKANKASKQLRLQQKANLLNEAIGRKWPVMSSDFSDSIVTFRMTEHELSMLLNKIKEAEEA